MHCITTAAPWTSAQRLTNKLATAPKPVFIAYATAAAFATYFCMYAFRKPFAAARFDGEHFLGGEVALKTAFVVSQIIGYTVSKYVGIKVCPEVRPGEEGRHAGAPDPRRGGRAGVVCDTAAGPQGGGHLLQRPAARHGLGTGRLAPGRAVDQRALARRIGVLVHRLQWCRQGRGTLPDGRPRRERGCDADAHRHCCSCPRFCCRSGC